MSISLKNMVNNQIDKWGINTLLISSSKKVKCKCYSDNTNEGKADCKLCLGSGKVTAIQKKKTILDSANTKFSVDTNELIGHLDPTEVSFYINSDTSVNTGDKIIIVGWDNNKLKDVKNIYTVGTVFEFRMDNGRVETYNVLAKKNNEKIKLYNDFVNKLSKENKEKIERGDMILCPN